MGVSSASRDIDFDARNEDIQGNIHFATCGVIIWLLILSQFKYFYRTQQSRKQEAKTSSLLHSGGPCGSRALIGFCFHPLTEISSSLTCVLAALALAHFRCLLLLKIEYSRISKTPHSQLYNISLLLVLIKLAVFKVSKRIDFANRDIFAFGC